MAATIAQPPPTASFPDLARAVCVLTRRAPANDAPTPAGGGGGGDGVGDGGGGDGGALGLLLLRPPNGQALADVRAGPAPGAAYVGPNFLADAVARLLLARAVAAVAAAAAAAALRGPVAAADGARAAAEQPLPPCSVTVPFLLRCCVGPGKPLSTGEPVEVRRACRGGDGTDSDSGGGGGGHGNAAEAEGALGHAPWFAAAAVRPSPLPSRVRYQVLLRGHLMQAHVRSGGGAVAGAAGVACGCRQCLRALPRGPEGAGAGAAAAATMAVPPSVFVAHAYGEAEAAVRREGGESGGRGGGGGGDGGNDADDDNRGVASAPAARSRLSPPRLPAAAQVFLPRVGPSGASLEEIVALAGALLREAAAGRRPAGWAEAALRCALCGEGDEEGGGGGGGGGGAAGRLRACGECGAALHVSCCGWVALHAGGRGAEEGAERGAPCALCLLSSSGAASEERGAAGFGVGPFDDNDAAHDGAVET